MRYIKPKDVGETLHLSPERISLLANHLEDAGLLSFKRTALGSYLFEEKDVEVLLKYHDTLRFFNRKSIALETFEETLFKKESKTERNSPTWINTFSNAYIV